MKKLLIISPYLPWPLSSGGNVGVFYMLSYLCNKVDISFITTYNTINDREKLESLKKKLPKVKIELYDYKKANNLKFELFRKVIRRINNSINFGNVQGLNSLNVLDPVSPGYISFINEYINKEKIDIVQIEFYEYLPLIYSLPEKIKKIFIHHELRFVRNDLSYGNGICDNFVKLFLKDVEISMLNRFDIVTALTQIDKEKLEAAGVSTKIVVSALAISDITQPYKKNISRNILTFVGGDGHYPNLDGINWFISNVFLYIEEEVPDVRFYIIGKWSKENMKRINSLSNKIFFLGFVEDLGTAIENSVMVVPLNIGSGMRMKILEASNCSIPFVSTVVGAEGLDFYTGVDCYIANNPKDMYGKILELLSNEKLYDDFSFNSHQTFIDKYSIEALGEKRFALY